MRNFIIIALSLSLSIFISCSGDKILARYHIKLETESLDKYGINPGGPFLQKNRPGSHYYEKIKKLPDADTIISTHTVCLQRKQNSYQSLAENPVKRKEFFSRSEQKFSDWQEKYTLDSLDCIVSICYLQDSSGSRYMVFDQNNDEDLSNDVRVAFQSRMIKHPYLDERVQINYSDSRVECEYYDGKSIRTGEHWIRILEAPGQKGVFFHYSRNGKFGHIKLENKKYILGIIKSGSGVENLKKDFLWIDTNKNNKLDVGQDQFEQMYLPFTFRKKSYVVEELDRWGESITLAACNPDSIPPVAEGLPAPDFSAFDQDSQKIKITDFSGSYVVFDIWSCNRGYSLDKQLSNEFQDDEVKIISFGEYRNRPGITIDWTHIDEASHPSIRELYQVGGSHTTFLISPGGIVLHKLVDGQKDEIVRLMREHKS